VRRMIQVLIVVLILLSCGGIVGPALVQVREAANRAQCTNNLRQLALAIGNYHDCYSAFPAAAEDKPSAAWHGAAERAFPTAAKDNPDLPLEKRLSWIVHIWPFVEAGPLYWKMDHKKGWDAEENRFAATEVLPKILICPRYSALPTRDLLPTCYVGITGIGPDAINLPLEDSRAGFFGYKRILKHEDLKGRVDSTLMLAETSQVHGTWTAAGSPTTRGLIPDGSPYIGAGGQFGGNHRRGANAAFADGSVRFIEQSIDPIAWEAMATLSGKGNQE
jgi:prepilin-type processing-associated H-X9-DG protein